MTAQRFQRSDAQRRGAVATNQDLFGLQFDLERLAYPKWQPGKRHTLGRTNRRKASSHDEFTCPTMTSLGR